MRWLNYQHLYYFWQVARHGSVTQASRHLRLAQPTISAQLKSFEGVLGEKLFEREGRKLRLTEAGQLACRYAEQIFGMGEEFLDTLDGKARGSSSELKVGIADVVPKSLAYRLLRPAFSASSEALVHCLEDKTERLLADLSIGEVDFVIADRPIPPNVKVKAYNHLIGECGVTFLGTRSLAQKHRSRFPKSLSDAPLLLPTAEAAVRGELERWFETKGFTPRCVGAFQDRALMKLAARDGRGIMPIPSVVEAEVRKEFQLEVIGRTTEVREELYVISIERRLKNPVIAEICAAAQTTLFPKSK